jgi:diguanylate cyclase (GGDEF)-like protein
MLLPRGGHLFSPGEKAEHLYLLQKGLVRVLRQNDDGTDDEIARFAPGDIIGDFDFARDAEYDAKVEAAEDSALIMFPGLGLRMENFALELPHVFSKILLNSAAMVTARIKGTRKLLMESESWIQELHRQVHEDSATGLLKQSFFDEEIDNFLENPMALIMLKPDRFKILVDALGHDAGDVAMVELAGILKSFPRMLGKGWALRFRSNETGLVINKCTADQAESLALSLFRAVMESPHVSLGDKGDFSFTGSIAWGIWPADDKSWDSLFQGTYQLLMDTWKAGGNKVVHYRKEQAQ